MSKLKDERLANALRELAAEYVNLESSRTSLITITRAEVEGRGRYAKIYFTVFPDNGGEPEKVLEKGTEIAEIKEEIEPLKTELIKKIARKKVEKKEKKSEGGVFSARIREYLTEKDIEIMDVISDKKKEFIAKIRFDIIFGKQEFFLIARDKKVIQDKDFEISLQRAQAEKMPMYFISSGELNKKAKDYLREWRNLIRFDRVSVDGV